MELQSRRLSKLKLPPKGIDISKLRSVADYALDPKINKSVQRIYQMIDEGTLTAYKIGNLILISTETQTNPQPKWKNSHRLKSRLT